MPTTRTFYLHQVAQIQAGHPFRGKIPERPGSDIVAVQMKDTGINAGIDWGSCLHTHLPGRRSAGLKDGQLLFAARGTHYYAVMVKGIPVKLQAVAAPHFFVVSTIDNRLLPEFLTWQLNQVPCQQYFEQNAEGSVAKSVRRSVLEGVPIVVPSLSKQQSIVGLASTLLKEQQTLEKLVCNNERLMAGIATELLKK